MKRLLLIALAAVVVLAACYWIASATTGDAAMKQRIAREEARRQAYVEDRAKRRAQIQAEKSALIAAKREARAKERREQERILAAKVAKEEAEVIRVTKEIRASVLAQAELLTLEIIANRTDGLVVRDSFGPSDVFYFVPHTSRTRRLANDATIKARCIRNATTYRTNDWTVLKTITIVE